MEKLVDGSTATDVTFSKDGSVEFTLAKTACAVGYEMTTPTGSDSSPTTWKLEVKTMAASAWKIAQLQAAAVTGAKATPIAAKTAFGPFYLNCKDEDLPWAEYTNALVDFKKVQTQMSTGVATTTMTTY